LICESVLYRHAWTFPLWVIQFAPEGADSSATLNAGIVTPDFAPLPDAPTAHSMTNETTELKIRNCTSLFTPTSS
jgi:hypothetical protein